MYTIIRAGAKKQLAQLFFFPDSHIFYSCFSLYTFTIRAVLCKFVYFNVSENVVSGNYKFLVRGLFLFPFANTYT